MSVSKKRATYDDLLALPENMVGEILDGELVASPRPAFPHAHAASVLNSDIGGSFGRPPGSGGPGGWWVLVEPELHFGQDVLVPDVAGWRRERMPRVPDVSSCELPPDWVCEVVSRSTVRFDRGKKMAIYARVAVRHLWFVDPLAKTLEIFSLADGKWVHQVTYEETARVRAEPFDAVELDLARWWIDTAP